MKPGDRYGRLTVLKLIRPKDGGRTRVLVKCACGNKKEVRRCNLANGNTTSCGCYWHEVMKECHTTHGHRRDGSEATATYQAWQSMVKNCNTPSSGRYDIYGALGVTVCDKWQGDGGFERFLKDMGAKPSEEHMLSRHDKKKDFTPKNTYWATKHAVDRNTRRTTMYTVGKRTQCLVDWAKEHGIPKNTLHYRVVTKGMTMRDALDVGRGTQGKLLPC
jgi:hypothetical protein